MKRIYLFIIAFVLNPICFLYADDRMVDIHGFIAQGILKSDHNNFLAETKDGTFEFNEMAINFSAQLAENLRLGMQLFSRDLGKLGNNQITLDWAYADLFVLNGLGLRAGKMKIPHGFYNESRDSDMMRTSIFLPQGMYNEAWRDSFISIKGISAYGYLWNHLSYQLQAGKMEAPMDGGLVKMYNGIGVVEVDSIGNDRAAYVANLQLYDIVNGLKIGTSIIDFDFIIDVTYSPSSGLVLPIPVGTKGMVNGSSTIWSAGFEYNYNAINISSEYVILSWDMPTSLLFVDNIDDLTPGYDMLTFDMEGWYINAAYRFCDWFEVGVMYSEFYWDRDDKDGTKYKNGILDFYEIWVNGPPIYWRWQKDTTISSRFDINENLIVKFEGHVINGVGICELSDNKRDDGSYDFKKNWCLFAAKIMYSY